MTLNKKLLKKLPFHLAVLLLTTSASLILGFLSFGGMFALWPVLPVALGAFVLSVAYEGEIYLQNIKGALNKLFKTNFLERQISNQFLLDNFPNTALKDCPKFFKAYEAQLHLLHRFQHKRLSPESEKQKKQIEKTLKSNEKWFAEQFFSQSDSSKSAHEAELKEWFATHQNEHKAYLNRRTYLKFGKAFSLFTGTLMGLGSTYLLLEAIAAIPLLATIPAAILPVIIVPMALVSGVAYGLLTYNAVTDMIANNTIRKWFDTLAKDFKDNGINFRNVAMTGLATFLVTLAATLTICTAGTWWTIAKNTRPLFNWMAKIPPVVMAFIGLDSFVFNLVNTKASWDMIYEATQADKHQSTKGFFSRIKGYIAHQIAMLQADENLLQMFNPFRIALKIALSPIRLVMFAGHLISMGAGDDRVPGLSEEIGAALSTTSEVFTDLHYFFDLAGGHHHHHHDTYSLLKERHNGHDHSHDNDLPTRFVKFLLTPVYFMAASWDYLSSKLNRKPLSFTEAWEKQNGIKPMQTVHLDKPHDTHHHGDDSKEHPHHAKATRPLTRSQNGLRNEKPAAVVHPFKEESSSTYGKHRFFGTEKTSPKESLLQLDFRRICI